MCLGLLQLTQQAQERIQRTHLQQFREQFPMLRLAQLQLQQTSK
jgi:hypothetical protein